MSAEKFGIENLQKVVSFGVTIGTALSEDLKDNKLSFLEVIQLATELSGVSDLLKNKDAIIQEAKDLSIDEVETLVKSVEGAINNAQVTAVIEHGLGVIVSVAALIQDFQKPAAPTA